MAPKNLTYLKIDYGHSEHVSREADPTDQWDADDVDHTYVIRGMSLGTDKSFDFIHEGPLKTPMYLVTVIYGTGDSFHTETGRCALAALVSTKTDADTVRQAIRANGGADTFTVKLANGRKVQIHPSEWTGYFETIEGVFVHPVRL